MFEDRFIYFPLKYPHGKWHPTDHSFAFEDCCLTAEDGTQLHGWYIRTDQTSKHLLYLHGNAGNIAYRSQLLQRLHRLPINIFIIDYRGYGRSQGKPSEQGLYQDARAAYGFLAQDKHIAPKDIIVFGKSLGGAVAVHLASQVEVGGLILQATFMDGHDMLRRKMRFLGLHALLRKFSRNQFDSRCRIRAITIPKLHIHGKRDRIVPFELGRQLFEAAVEPKEFLALEHYAHDNFDAIDDVYDTVLRRFIKRC